MSCNSFKDNVMVTSIQKRLKEEIVYAKHTVREYEGEIKNAGDVVTIRAFGSPTITTRKDGTAPVFGDPEKVQGSNLQMKITHTSAFNFVVPDYDEAFIKGDIETYIKGDGMQRIAEEQDQCIADTILGKGVARLNTSATVATKANCLELLDESLITLRKNKVSTKTMVYAYVSWDFQSLLFQRITELDTDNSDLIKTGAFAKYRDIMIIPTNTIAMDGSDEILHVRTAGAIAFADAVTKVKAQDAAKDYGDEIRGFSAYGAKVIRPDQIVGLNVKYA